MTFAVVYGVLVSGVEAFQLKPTSLSSKEAVVGHSVHLPCEFSYVPENPVLILWYKNQNTRPFYSFDAREMVGGQHKVHDQFNLGKRANFSYKTNYAPKNIVGHLVIKNVTMDDAGNFTCRVDFQKAQTAMALLQLEVHEPIWRLSVVDIHEREVGRETSPYEEGKRLLLTCRAYGGHPLPTVRWLSRNVVLATSEPRDSKKLDFIQSRNRWQNVEISSADTETESVLQIPALKREDQGRIFTCQANNSRLTPIRTKIISLNMSLRPIHIEIEVPARPLWSGKEAQFTCRSWGSRPPAKLQWGPKSILKMLNFQTSLDQNITISQAQLIPTPDDDGVSINCTATNPNVRSYKMSSAKKLIVYYAPQVEVQLASVFSADKIKEGDDVFFECKVKANPKPTSLVWFHEGEILHEQKKKGILVQGQNLVLQKVSRNSRGKFQCRATNDVATVTSEPVTLQIMFVPECSEENITVLVSEDEEVLLNCSVVSYPQPTEFIWRLNGSNGWQNIDSQKISSRGLSSTFAYSLSKRGKGTRETASGFVEEGRNSNRGVHRSRRSHHSRVHSESLATRMWPLRGLNDLRNGNTIWSNDNLRNDNNLRSINSLRNDNDLRSIGSPRNDGYSLRSGDNLKTVDYLRNGNNRVIYGYSQDKQHFNTGESYGVVYCMAKNAVGKQKEPCVFNISPAGPPEKLISCSFANQSATTLQVACRPGKTIGLRQYFRAVAFDQDSKDQVANMTSSKPEFYIKDLIPGKDYLVIVTAFNSKGSSEPYVLEGFALKVAENKIKNENGIDKSPLLKLFLAVISGFVIVIGILIFITRARYKRRNNENRSRRDRTSHNKQESNAGEKDPLSPSSNPSSADDTLNDGNDKESNERDSCLQVPDITAQTPDSLGSISTLNSDKFTTTTRRIIEDGSQSYNNCIASTPPPLLGLSNTYARIGGLPRPGSNNHGFNAFHDISSNINKTLAKAELLVHSPSPQPLPSVDLTKVSSNVNKYYSLKINCTRQTNESFV